MRGLVLAAIVLLAFACNGGGGGLRTVTPVPSPEATPSPTPAAEPTAAPQIAYVGADGAIWLADADGRVRKKFVEIDRCPDRAALVWSPAGDRLACVGGESDDRFLLGVGPRPLPNSVVVVDPEGRVLKEIELVASFAWSPTGRHMAYTVLSGTEPSAVATLLVADADAAEIAKFENVAIGGGPSVPDFAWSPDGREMAYVKEVGNKLAIYNLDEREERAVAGDYRPLAWVLEGRKMLVTANYQPPREAPNTAFGECPLDCYEANLLDLASGQLARVQELDDGRQHWLSPDGASAVFLSWRGLRLELTVLDFATLSSTPIESSDTGYPSHSIPFGYVAFSPDSSLIYWNDPGSEGIYTARTDGTGMTKLASVAAVMVQFSPDLTKVAYLRADDPSGLWIANIDGSGAVQIGPAGITFAWRFTP